MTISAGEADPTDAPWDVEVVYRPFDGDGSGEGGKRYKAWKKSLTTLKGKSELSLRASAPGEYTIVGVKGKVSLALCCVSVVCLRAMADVFWSAGLFLFFSGVKGMCWRLKVVKSSRSSAQAPRLSGRGYTNGKMILEPTYTFQTPH